MDEKKINEIDTPTAEPTPSATTVAPETSFTVVYQYKGIYHPENTDAAAPTEPKDAPPVGEPGEIAYSEAAGEMRAPEVTLPETEPSHTQTDRPAREDDETVIPTEPETPLYAEVAERPGKTATAAVASGPATASKAEPQKRRVSGFAVMSFLCGLAAVFSSWLGYTGALMSIVGLAFVSVSARRDPDKKLRVFAVLGLIVCLVALVLSSIFIAVRWLPGVDLSFPLDATAFLG